MLAVGDGGIRGEAVDDRQIRLQWSWCSPGCPTARVKVRPGVVREVCHACDHGSDRLEGMAARRFSERKREEMCAEAHDGKRFWLEGYLQLPSNIEIRNEEGRALLLRAPRRQRSGRRSLDQQRRSDHRPETSRTSGRPRPARRASAAVERRRSMRMRCASAPRTDLRPPATGSSSPSTSWPCRNGTFRSRAGKSPAANTSSSRRRRPRRRHNERCQNRGAGYGAARNPPVDRCQWRVTRYSP